MQQKKIVENIWQAYTILGAYQSGMFLLSYFLYKLKIIVMVKKALLVRLEAKPGKEKELEEFLNGGLQLAQAELDTISWYAIKINDSTFGIFDTFHADAGRDAHLSGPIAKALMEKAPDLLASNPVIEKVDVLAAK